MIERTRAWRRRKMRTATVRLNALKVWLKDPFPKPDAKPGEERKRRPGASAHAHDLRERWSSTLELREADGLDEKNGFPERDDFQDADDFRKAA